MAVGLIDCRHCVVLLQGILKLSICLFAGFCGCLTRKLFCVDRSSPYKSPWARLYTYTGKRIKKTGQVTKQEVVSYPRDTTTTSTNSDQFTPAIIPADLVSLFYTLWFIVIQCNVPLLGG